MKVRISIVYEFERKESYVACTKSSVAADAIAALYKMSWRDLAPLCKVQVAKETWLEVEE